MLQYVDFLAEQVSGETKSKCVWASNTSLCMEELEPEKRNFILIKLTALRPKKLDFNLEQKLI